jgi:drug/metabolite transporter (DMT)-like permease
MTRRPVSQRTVVFAAIVITILSWASAFIVIRGVAPYFDGGALALARLVVGTVLLSFFLIRKKWVRPNGREWLLIAGFGIVWFGAYNVLLNIAEHSVDAGTTAMIIGAGPILIALGGGLFLGEGLHRWLAIGAGVAFLGVVLIGIAEGGLDLHDGLGVLFALVAAVAYAAGVLFQKPALKRLPNAQVTWLGCAIGTVACLPFAWQLIGNLTTAPVGAILGAVYLGAVPTALAFSTWAYALSRMPAGQLGIATYLVPPLVILLGFLVFSEVPAVLAIIGGVCCLVGVALSRRRRRIPANAESLAE